MHKGDPVRVYLINGQHVAMRVWAAPGPNVLLCKPEAFEAAKKSGRKPQTVEYREWAIEPGWTQ